MIVCAKGCACTIKYWGKQYREYTDVTGWNSWHLWLPVLPAPQEKERERKRERVSSLVEWNEGGSTEGRDCFTAPQGHSPQYNLSGHYSPLLLFYCSPRVPAVLFPLPQSYSIVFSLSLSYHEYVYRSTIAVAYYCETLPPLGHCTYSLPHYRMFNENCFNLGQQYTCGLDNPVAP